MIAKEWLTDILSTLPKQPTEQYAPSQTVCYLTAWAFNIKPKRVREILRELHSDARITLAGDRIYGTGN